jgi:hypothetical protein
MFYVDRAMHKFELKVAMVFYVDMPVRKFDLRLAVNETINKWRHAMKEIRVFGGICMLHTIVVVKVTGLTHAVQVKCILLSKDQYVGPNVVSSTN